MYVATTKDVVQYIYGRMMDVTEIVTFQCMEPSSEFELFTSLRYDPSLYGSQWNTWVGCPPSPFLLLPYHYDRLLQAAKQFEWPAAIHTLTAQEDTFKFMKSLCDDCVSRQDDRQQTLRIRILLSQDGSIRTQAFPTPPLDHDLLYASTFNPDTPANFQYPTTQPKVYVDSEATPSSLYTSNKTTSRNHYDAARARLGISGTTSEEVLLYNLDHEITEGSVRSVSFWRNGHWVTPALASGCLSGTIRRLLLEQGRIVEGKIKRDEVKEGEWVLLNNGVQGCLLGKIYKRD